MPARGGRVPEPVPGRPLPDGRSLLRDRPRRGLGPVDGAIAVPGDDPPLVTFASPLSRTASVRRPASRKGSRFRGATAPAHTAGNPRGCGVPLRRPAALSGTTTAPHAGQRIGLVPGPGGLGPDGACRSGPLQGGGNTLLTPGLRPRWGVGAVRHAGHALLLLAPDVILERRLGWRGHRGVEGLLSFDTFSSGGRLSRQPRPPPAGRPGPGGQDHLLGDRALCLDLSQDALPGP
jgi:hypothetical protein